MRSCCRVLNLVCGTALAIGFCSITCSRGADAQSLRYDLMFPDPDYYRFKTSRTFSDVAKKVMQDVNDIRAIHTLPAVEPVHQVSQIDNLAALGTNGIAIWSIDPFSLTPSINKAEAEGIRVVTFGVDAPSSQRAAFVGSDPYEIAINLGTMIRQANPSGGQLCHVSTLPNEVEDRELLGLRDSLARSTHSTSSPPLKNEAGWTELGTCTSPTDDVAVEFHWDHATATKGGRTIAEVKVDPVELGEQALKVLHDLNQGHRLTDAETKKKPECGKPCGSSSACGSFEVSRVECPCKSSSIAACGS